MLLTTPLCRHYELSFSTSGIIFVQTLSMNWFETLFGFKERDLTSVYNNLEVRGQDLYSRANRRSYQSGSLELVSLGELRRQVTEGQLPSSRLTVEEVVGDVQDFHAEASNAGCLFQAASQFNLLEMVGPHVKPEEGITRYEYDRTQGPACAIACAAGTVYRNYFVEHAGQVGQAKGKQIDCLGQLGAHLNNAENQFWQFRNGYALGSQTGLQALSDLLRQATPSEYDHLKSLIQVGIQWNAEVTLPDCGHLVSQLYCSALPVAYSHVEARHWEAFSRLILESIYESTLLAGIRNLKARGKDTLYLTLVGGGAFGNEDAWIRESILSVLKKYTDCGLHIRFVSYGRTNPLVQQIIAGMTK